MTIQLDAKLIDNFWDKFDECNILQDILKDKDGKNLFNIICSATDWLRVAVDGLPKIDITPTPGVIGHNHFDTLQLMQYILTIDILAESMVQLFRVFDPNNDFPLKGDNTVFQQSSIDDDQYFKHIRAVFSTHPINLTSVDGIKKQDGERFYASFVGSRGPVDHDFFAFLYSNNPEKGSDDYIGINILDLNAFAEKRYELLNKLISMIGSITDAHMATYSNKTIAWSNNPFEQLEILLEENKIRFGRFSGFAGDLVYVSRMINTDISSIMGTDCENVVNEYKQFLVTKLPLIRIELQRMQVKHLINIQREGYEISKIYDYLYDQHSGMGEIFFKQLITDVPFPLNINSHVNKDLNQLILNSYIHKKSSELGRKVNFNDLIN